MRIWVVLASAAIVGCGRSAVVDGPIAARGEPDVHAAAPENVTDTATVSVEHLYRGAHIAGQGEATWDVGISGGLIVAVTPVGSLTSPDLHDVSGRWLAPAAIDSHVHLAYYPAAAALAEGGVAAVVDLAAPPAFFTTNHAPLDAIGSGPMLTATRGYPTQGWGSDGYGTEIPIGDVAAAEAAVDAAVALGAAVLKVPIDSGPTLTDAQLSAIAARAHKANRRVAVHALSDAAVARAAAMGADILAHCPTEPLSDATVAAWGARSVIATLSAFGGAAVANLGKLRAVGNRVLYGTDFGNTTALGISPAEVALLTAAGLDGAAILASMTSEPAAFWGFTTLGHIAPGQRASLLVLGADPLVTPATLATPVEVVQATFR